MKEIKIKTYIKDLTSALKRLESALNSNYKLEDKIDLTVKRFEFTFETFWKFLKVRLENEGIQARSPRETFKKAVENNLIEESNIWLDMIDARNITSHEYNLGKVEIIYPQISSYYRQMNHTLQQIAKTYKN